MRCSNPREKMIKTLIDQNTPITTGELIAKTGLSRGSVGTWINKLLDMGIIELTLISTPHRGRHPAFLLSKSAICPLCGNPIHLNGGQTE